MMFFLASNILNDDVCMSGTLFRAWIIVMVIIAAHTPSACFL